MALYDTRVTLSHLVVFTLFLALPFVDMVNGYLVLSGSLEEGGVFSPSQVARAVFVTVLVIFSFKYKISFNWVWLILAGVVIESVNAIGHQYFEGYLIGIIVVYRLLYFAILTCVISKIYQEMPQLLYRYMKLNLCLVAGSVVAAFAFDVGFSTYGWGLGTKGFFASGNGLGLYIGGLTFVLISLRCYNDSFRLHFLYVLLACLSLLCIGSKTAFVFSFVVLVLYILTSKYRVLLIPLSLLVLVIGFGHFLSILSSALDVVISRFNSSESLYGFLASGRIGYVLDAFEVFNQHNPSIHRYVFGAGAFTSYQNINSVQGFDTLETDLFDVFFMYGLFGVAIYIAFIMYGFYLLRRHWILLIAWLLLSLHSILAGHVLLNAMSISLVAILMALSLNLNRFSNR